MKHKKHHSNLSRNQNVHFYGSIYREYTCFLCRHTTDRLLELDVESILLGTKWTEFFRTRWLHMSKKSRGLTRVSVMVWCSQIFWSQTEVCVFTPWKRRLPQAGLRVIFNAKHAKHFVWDFREVYVYRLTNWCPKQPKGSQNGRPEGTTTAV